VLTVAVLGLGAVLAATCLIIGFFLWPKEEHRLHSMLEEWWVRVDDRGHREQARVDAFVTGIAQSISGLYDYILGRKLVTERVFVVSFIVNWFAFNSFVYIRGHTNHSGSASSSEMLSAMFSTPIYIVLVLYGLYGVLLWFYIKYEHRKLWLRRVVRAIVTLIVLANGVLMFVFEGWLASLLTLLLMGLAISFGVVVLALIRVLIRQASRSHTAVSRSLYFMGSLFLGSVIFAFALNTHFLHPAHQGSQVLRVIFIVAGNVAMINGMSLLVVGTLLLGSAVLLIYRIMWPALSRVVYIGPRHRIVYRRQLLAAFATTLGLGLSSVVFSREETMKFLVFEWGPAQPDNTVCLSADLYLRVTTHGQPTDAWFEWGPTMALGKTTKHRIFNYDSRHRETIINLSEGTTYFYRGAVNNHLGTARGKVRTFTTRSLPPGVDLTC
jgi:hypothetical protein